MMAQRLLSDARRVLAPAAVRAGILPGRKAVPFIIVGGPRTGSTLLQTLINSHPGAVCMHELLKEKARPSVFYRYYVGRRRALLRMRPDHMKEFLEEVLLSRQPGWVHAVGFKALYTQPHTETTRREAWRLLGQIPDLRVIWISRNPIRSVVSYAIARETRRWIGGTARKAISIDPAYLLRRLELEARLAQEARDALSTAALLDVTYERLVESPDEEIARILAFLGNLKPHPLSSGLRRQNPEPLAQLVDNWAEVERALRDTRWWETARSAG